jgi:DNA-binding beta-propeller fold protein YncE
MTHTARPVLAAMSALVAVVAVNSSAAASVRSSTLPDPVRIVARWSAKSLGLDHPKALAIGSNGNLYMTDLSQRVSEISPQGKVLRRWGRRGRGPGEFDFVPGDLSAPLDVNASIAVGPDGKVYVSDSGNARVEVFSADGRFIREFGRFGRGKADFLSPFDLVVDRSGNVYVVDDQLESVRKFSPTGKVLWSIGGPGSDPDLVGHHHLSMIDAHGRILIANDDKARISYVDLQSHKVDAFGERSDFPSDTCDATADAAGYTYVNGCGVEHAATSVFDPAHRLVVEWLGSPLKTSPRFGPRGEIFALAWDGSLLKLRITHPPL